MAAASGNDDTLDRSLADAAGLAFTAIDAMPELEKSFFSVGVHVIRDGRTTQLNRFVQDLLQPGVQLGQLIVGDARGPAAGANAGAEQGFVGIDVPYPSQEFLVQQRAFDGSLAAAEKGNEAGEIDFKRFQTSGIECGGHAQASEAARVNEAQFPP